MASSTMKLVQFHFTGLMCPVFTPFNDDNQRTVNYVAIDKYSTWLKSKGINGVLINGTVSEGTCLSLNERKHITEEWVKACHKHQLHCMVQVGGASVADVHELAAHAERYGVDAVLCLPDLFFKPKIEEDLVHYMKEVALCCPTRPLFYYHIPQCTDVRLSMVRFCELAEKEIPNYCGLEYANSELDEGVACLKPGRHVFIGADKILVAALSQGFDSAILTAVNMFPEYPLAIFKHMKNNDVKKAEEVQVKMNQRFTEIFPEGGDWVRSMKNEFNKTVSAFQVGPCRKPVWNLKLYS